MVSWLNRIKSSLDFSTSEEQPKHTDYMSEMNQKLLAMDRDLDLSIKRLRRVEKRRIYDSACRRILERKLNEFACRLGNDGHIELRNFLVYEVEKETKKLIKRMREQGTINVNT